MVSHSTKTVHLEVWWFILIDNYAYYMVKRREVEICDFLNLFICFLFVLWISKLKNIFCDFPFHFQDSVEISFWSLIFISGSYFSLWKQGSQGKLIDYIHSLLATSNTLSRHLKRLFNLFCFKSNGWLTSRRTCRTELHVFWY